MNKPYKLLLCILFLTSQAFATRSLDTLKLNQESYEKLFLERNLSLIAQGISISQEEALLVQEKAWNNPSLSISEVNLWTPSKQDSSQQFELALETLIQTAGKRKHRIQLQALSKELAIKEYEYLLRSLKKELRSKLAEFIYYQEILPIYTTLNKNILQVLEVDKQQTALRNHPREELLRLQTMSLGLTKEIYALQQDKEALASELKQFIQVGAKVHLVVLADKPLDIRQAFDNINLNALTDFEMRPDIQMLTIEKKQTQASLKLAKAEAYPDLNLGVSYNRFDGMWKDYISFGISFDLPVFNRNQGHIRFAKEQLKLQENKDKQYRMEVAHDLEKDYNKLAKLLAIQATIESDYQEGLEAMLQIYTQDYMSRNVNLLSFLDIQEAYLQGQDMLLSLEKELVEAWETLQFQLGTQI